MKKLVAALALFGPLLLSVHLLYEGQEVSLLQQPTLRSSAYYKQLASSDAWLAGPSQLQSQRSELKTRVKAARTQELTDWNSGALAGTASFVTRCAHGDNAACDQLIADPGAVQALKNIDKTNPRGFASHQGHVLRERTPVHNPSELTSPRFHGWGAEERPPAQARQEQARVPAWLRQYRTSAQTKGEWNTAAWRSGALTDAADDQWLKSCGEGNYYACQHLALNNDALHDLLHPKHKFLHKIANEKPPPLAPVFVAPRKQSFLSSVLSSLGLGDSFVQNGDDEEGQPAKMVPDRGLTARGRTAEYNDGTVGAMSDES